MGITSQLGALNNAIENRKKLQFARNTLSKEQFTQLYKSYKRLYWFQLIPIIVFAIGFILIMIFVPSQEVPNGHADYKMTLLLFGVAFFIFFFSVWLILSQFIVGKLWHKYSKWYKRKSCMDELYALFIE